MIPNEFGIFVNLLFPQGFLRETSQSETNEGKKKKKLLKAYVCEGFYLMIDGMAGDYTLKMVTRKTDTVVLLYGLHPE